MANPVTNLGEKATAGMTRLSSAMEGFFRTIDAGLNSVQRTMGRFVELSNPAALNQFTLAMRDMQAVIGQILTPVLNNMTRLVRSLGDAIINLTPKAKAGIAVFASLAVGMAVATAAAAALSAVINTLTGGLPAVLGAIVGLITSFGLFVAASGEAKEITKALNGVLDAVFSAILDMAKPLISVAASLAPMFKPLVEILAVLAKLSLTPLLLPLEILSGVLVAMKPVIDSVATAMQQFAEWLMKIFGIVRTETNKSSVGAAMKNVQISDVSSFINQAQIKAFQGAGSKEDPIKSTLGELTTTMLLVRDATTQLLAWLEKRYGEAKEPLKTVANKVGDAVVDAAPQRHRESIWNMRTILGGIITGP